MTMNLNCAKDPRGRASEEPHATNRASHSDDEDEDHPLNKKQKKNKNGGHTKLSKHDGPGPSRTRPTNNQMMYKAHFRWSHDNINASALDLLEATDPCPSVASCFLQVLQVLQTAEQHRGGSKRNILQILSNNTRRTKVVELSSGTHRIPDELRKNFLSDGVGGQYSTNLDRNRYGSDDNYLFTVIRHDLEILRLCPCMVDVEIIDSKAGNASTLVQCGLDGCGCSNKAQHIAARAADEAAAAAAAATAGGAAAGPRSVMPSAAAAGGAAKEGFKALGLEGPMACGSNNSGSSLFDALVLPAGGQRTAELPPMGVVCMPDLAGVARPSILDASPDPTTSHAALLGAGDDDASLLLPFSKPRGAVPQRQGEGTRKRPLPQKSRSRLWSALSMGDLDSLQNALDEYVKGGGDEEIFSGPLNVPLGGEAEVAAAAPGGDKTVARLGRRKPHANSSFLLMGTDSTGFSGLSKLGLSLFEDDHDSEDSFKADIAARLDSGVLPLGIGEEGGETGAGVNLNSSNDLTDTMQKRSSYHRPVPRQATVSSMSCRVAAEKMAAEIDALTAENAKLRNAKNAGMPNATQLFDLEQNLIEHKAKVALLKPNAEAMEQREQAAQQRAAEAEARNASLVRELAKSKAEVTALLSSLSGTSTSYGGTSSGFLAPDLSQYQGNKSSGTFDFSPFPFSWQQQHQPQHLQQQLQQHQQLHHQQQHQQHQQQATLPFFSMQGHSQLQASASAQGPVLNALYASQLAAGMLHPHPLGHSGQGYSTLL